MVRKVFLRLNANIKFTGDAGAGNKLLPEITYGSKTLVSGETDSIRHLALQNIAESLTIRIGDAKITEVPKLWIAALTRYGWDETMKRLDNSKFGSQADRYQNYGDHLQIGGPNPIRRYSGMMPGRLALEHEIVSNDQFSAEINVEWEEVLCLSPLFFSRGMRKSFFNIDKFRVYVSFANTSRIWSHDAVNNAVFTAPPVVSFDKETQYISLEYLNPPISLLGPVPKINSYSFYNMFADASNQQRTLAQGAYDWIDSGYIQLTSIPSRLYFFGIQQDARS